MDEDKALAAFEGKKIRRTWHNEEWWFVIEDIVEALTDSVDPKGYIKDMRRRDEELSKGWGQIATPLAISTPGGLQNVNCTNTEGAFRIIQSISSPRAEPFKLWLAKVGYERVQEMGNPELSLNRARETWQKYGMSLKWIQQRMMGQETRNKLTDYWKSHDITKEQEFAILTNIIHQEWSEVTVKEHKELKNLKNQNLRDHMTEAELIFTALAEMSTRQIAESVEASGLPENAVAGKKGGGIAKKARLDLEKKTGRKIISKENYLPPKEGKEPEKIV
jgi:prophage antirepressor-like protein